MQWPRTQVAWVYKTIVCMQLNMGPCMGIALGLDRLWAIIRSINIVYCPCRQSCMLSSTAVMRDIVG